MPLVAVLGCGPELGSELENRSFVSEQATEDGEPRPLPVGRRLSLSFLDDPQISASVGCNSFGHTYSIEDGKLVMDAYYTLIGCSPSVNELENWYFAFLESHPSITYEGDELTLEGDGIRIDYIDEELVPPDLELRGPTWTVEGIVENEFATQGQWPSPATLVFHTDRTVSIETGCNSGFAGFFYDGDGIELSDVVVTERGCEGDAAVLERAVLDVLVGPQPVPWGISSERLYLRGETIGLVLVGSNG